MDEEVSILLLGPARRRQGLGPFLARAAEAAGGRLVACAGRDPQRTERAAAALATDLGHAVAPAADLAALLAHAEGLSPVLLIVAAPPAAHEAALEAALAAGVHVLCEKPLLSGRHGLGRRAAAFAEAFFARGLHFFENVQWPETLEAYDALLGPPPARPPQSFEMELAPAAGGARALADSLPHALSLLQARTGAARARIENARLETAPARLVCRFEFTTADFAVDCRVDLRLDVATPPRPAAYGFDGRIARRRIEEPGYRQYFEAEGRRVAVPDPLHRHAARALAALRAGPPAHPSAGIAGRAAMLEALLSLAPDKA